MTQLIWLTHLLLASIVSARAEVCWVPHGGGKLGFTLAAQNISYQTGPDSQKLDIYIPNAFTPPYPTVIVIHGGCFEAGTKDDPGMVIQIERLTNAGYAVVNLDYRLAQIENKRNFYPASLEDVQDAVRWVRQK